MKSRIVVLFIGVCFLWSTLLVRGFYLKFFPDSKLRAATAKQFERVIHLNPRRGDILDRNGEELAISATTYSLFADPKIIEDRKIISRKLAPILGISRRVIAKKLKNKSKRFIWLKRNMDRKTYHKIKSLKYRGIAFKKEFKRFYPNGTLASQILGMTGKSTQGLEGLEKYYDKMLSADGQKITIRRDARGRPLIDQGFVFTEHPTGDDIVLTIDKEVQFFVEQELERVVAKFGADGAWGVVLKAQTSEVLALGSYPHFDPNKPSRYKLHHRKNRAITDVFEQGSTIKSFLIAGALKYDVVEPNSVVDGEGGKFKIGGRYIKEADKKHSMNKMTIMDILAKSSNVGASKIGLKMGADTIYDVYREFGFGEKTGIDFPGEEKGLLRSPPWRDHLTANISFGHGMAATPLQVANAYAVIANGGNLMRPFIVKERRSLANGAFVVNEPEVVRRVLTEEEAQEMRMLLAMVPSKEGTAHTARIEGYLVAGKTGTAQKVDPKARGYMQGKYISSFVGFLPANAPEYVIYIGVDNPSKNGYYATTVAAPVFKNVGRFLIRKKGLVPVIGIKGQVVEGPVTIAEVKKVIEEKVKKANPQDLEPLSKVPNLKGKSLREVIKVLRGRDVSVEIRGKGVVSSVHPKPGSTLKKGRSIRVRLRR